MASKEKIEKALSRYRDFRFAELLTIAVALAAEQYPDELRKALAVVFDLSAVEESTKRIMEVLSRAQEAALKCQYDTQSLLDAVERDFERLEKRMDAFQFEMEKRQVKQ